MFNPFKSVRKNSTENTLKAVLRIKGMHCVSCGMNIDGQLEDIKGVINASTNYAREKCVVEFDPKIVKVGKLLASIKELGYEVMQETP